MIPRSLASLLLVVMLPVATALRAQPAEGDAPPPLVGHIEGKNYVSPTGMFKVEIPVLLELGGAITDNDNLVTFQDEFSVHETIACIKMDATLRWEKETRGTKDFLVWFFSNQVLADFQQQFPGSKLESAKFRPSLQDGALLTYVLLPGGSSFEGRIIVATGEEPPVAKRGNLVFVKDECIYVISIELAEKVLDRSTWDKKPEQEDEILTKRLLELLAKIKFTPPPAAASTPSK